MDKWLSAGSHHRPKLEHFECGPKLTPRYGPRLASFRHTREHWAYALQRKIHRLEPPVVPPEYLKIHLDDDSDRIDALAWFEVKISPDDPATVSVQIGALAVSPDCRRDGLGSEGLDLVQETAAVWTREYSPQVTHMVLTGDVHPKNEACMALITARGWSLLDKRAAGGYRTWGAAYRIDEKR